MHGDPYEIKICPKCGNMMQDGQCMNPGCVYHCNSKRGNAEKIEIVGTDPAKIIRSILEQEGLNQKELADKMGVVRQNVNQTLNRNSAGMRFDSFERMIFVLGYEIVVRKK